MIARPLLRSVYAMSLSALLVMITGCADHQAAPQIKMPPVEAPPAEPPPPPPQTTLTADMASFGATNIYVTQPKDTLLDVARTYDLGFTQLMTANRGLDPWNPGVGKDITLPGRYLLPDVPRKGIVINLPQHRLYYFPRPDQVQTFPIGVGVDGRATPLGTTKVAKKELHPTWHVPASIRAEDPDLPAKVGPGPDNPLGDHAFLLGWATYLIHGTNKPYGVGRNVSHGCIHLYPEDMERLFGEVPVGTPVRVIDQEVMTAWIDGDLYLAAYPSKRQAEAIDLNQPMPAERPKALPEQIRRAMQGHHRMVDWQAVEAAVKERSGIPVRVSRPPLVEGTS